jgi:hypothetical protein
MADLPDLSGDPEVREATLEKIADTNAAIIRVGVELGVDPDELRRMRADGDKTLNAVRTNFERKQAIWN